MPAALNLKLPGLNVNYLLFHKIFGLIEGNVRRLQGKNDTVFFMEKGLSLTFTCNLHASNCTLVRFD